MKISNLDHTADAGVKIIAGTLEELFRGAAQGMYRVTGCTGKGTTEGTQTLELKEDSLDILLVSFLNELNYYISTHYQVLEPIKKITVEEDGDNWKLICVAETKKIGREELEELTEIKAVTYHQLEIKRENDGYHTQIIFDL